MNSRSLLRRFPSHGAALAGALFLTLVTAGAAGAGWTNIGSVQGLVESNGIGLRNYQVSLYASVPCEGGENSHSYSGLQHGHRRSRIRIATTTGPGSFSPTPRPTRRVISR